MESRSQAHVERSLEDRAGHLDRGLLPDPPVPGSPGRHPEIFHGRSRGAFALWLLSAIGQTRPWVLAPETCGLCRLGLQVGF